MFDIDDELAYEGWLNGHDVCRDEEDGGIWYDGYYCADAMDYEEAETEYWNTHGGFILGMASAKGFAAVRSYQSGARGV